jgi:hypothetical protein
MSLFGIMGDDVTNIIESARKPFITPRDRYGRVVIKIPVVNREKYTMYLELYDGVVWFHTDVLDWTSSIKKNYMQDLNTLQELVGVSFFATAKETNTKLIKFGESIGFKYGKHFSGNDDQMYVIYSRSK